jgi:putative flippase GtrA
VRILIQEALIYTTVSTFSLFVDMAILWILVRYFSSPYLPAASASLSVGLLVAYAFSVTAVFKYQRLNHRIFVARRYLLFVQLDAT